MALMQFQEIRKMQNFEDWKNCSELIKIIANDFSYFMEKTRLIFSNTIQLMFSDKDKRNSLIFNCKIEILSMQHDLNEKLLKYKELIDRLTYINENDSNTLHDFYMYVYKAIEIRYIKVENIFDKLDFDKISINEIENIADFKKYNGDSSLLTSAINTATRNYKHYIHKEDRNE